MSLKSNTIAEALKLEMAKRGENQTRAAISMGIDQARVSLWLRGRLPSPEYVMTLSKYLGCSMLEFAWMAHCCSILLAKESPRKTSEEVVAMSALIEGRLNEYGAPPAAAWKSFNIEKMAELMGWAINQSIGLLEQDLNDVDLMNPKVQKVMRDAVEQARSLSKKK